MGNISIRYSSLEQYIDRLKNNEKFTLSRFGDGEWYAIMGDKGRNCDNVKYTRDLEKELIKVIMFPLPYEYGMLRVALDNAGKRIKEFIQRYEVPVKWVDADFIIAANRTGNLYPFLTELRKKRILYVGPKHLQQLDGHVFDIKRFVEVPGRKAFENRVDIQRKILKDTSGIDLIGVSMGPGGKVLIHNLYAKLRNSVTIMDFGSMWDGYCGVYSRGYMRTAEWEQTVRDNLGIKHVYVK